MLDFYKNTSKLILRCKEYKKAYSSFCDNQVFLYKYCAKTCGGCYQEMPIKSTTTKEQTTTTLEPTTTTIKEQKTTKLVPITIKIQTTTKLVPTTTKKEQTKTLEPTTTTLLPTTTTNLEPASSTTNFKTSTVLISYGHCEDLHPLVFKHLQH